MSPPPNNRPRIDSTDRFGARRVVSPRKRMMAQGRKAHFVYDMRELLKNTKMNETDHRHFIETIFQRGTRQSSEEAKLVLHAKLDDNTLTRKECDMIADLIERYSFWR